MLADKCKHKNDKEGKGAGHYHPRIAKTFTCENVAYAAKPQRADVKTGYQKTKTRQ